MMMRINDLLVSETASYQRRDLQINCSFFSVRSSDIMSSHVFNHCHLRLEPSENLPHILKMIPMVTNMVQVILQTLKMRPTTVSNTSNIITSNVSFDRIDMTCNSKPQILAISDTCVLNHVVFVKDILPISYIMNHLIFTMP